MMVNLNVLKHLKLEQLLINKMHIKPLFTKSHLSGTWKKKYAKTPCKRQWFDKELIVI